MNEGLVNIYSYVFDLLKFAEAKNVAIFVFNVGAIGFVAKLWLILFSGTILTKFFVVLSLLCMIVCTLLLLLTFTTLFNAKLQRSTVHQLSDDILSITELGKATPQSLISAIYGNDSPILSEKINQSLAAKIIINARSTEMKIVVFEKCILGTIFWIMLLSGSVYMQSLGH